MQLAKVVIASALVLAACAEGLPEGKSCVLKYILDVKLFRTMAVIVCCSMIPTCFVQWISPLVHHHGKSECRKYLYLLACTTEDTRHRWSNLLLLFFVLGIHH